MTKTLYKNTPIFNPPTLKYLKNITISSSTYIKFLIKNSKLTKQKIPTHNNKHYFNKKN